VFAGNLSTVAFGWGERLGVNCGREAVDCPSPGYQKIGRTSCRLSSAMACLPYRAKFRNSFESVENASTGLMEVKEHG
jgi:hypothetical protein